MTNAQKWMGVFLVLFLALFLLGKMTEKEETFDIEEDYYAETNTESAPQANDGLKLINNVGCTACHGVDLGGTKMAPALTNLKEYWTRNELINYLRNPSSYADENRLKEYKEQFKNIMMPSYNNIDVKDLGKMADYLLEK